MYEEDLRRAICLQPSIIEDGLKIEEAEYPIRGAETTYRCDLRAVDKEGKTLLIELKLIAGQRVLFQIGKYKTFLPSNARFMVVALEFEREVQVVLNTFGFETRKVSRDIVEALLIREAGNPGMYIEKSSVTTIPRKTDTPRQTHSGWEEGEEEQVVREFFARLEQLARANTASLKGITLLGFDERGDKFRLLFALKNHPTDRIVVYTRPRKRDEVHLQYVPDFSPNTGNTPKKKLFEQYALARSHDLEAAYGLPVFGSRGRPPAGDRIEVTCQAWKGLTHVVCRDTRQWAHDDFIELMAERLVRFTETTLPIVDGFYRHNTGVR